MLVFSLHRLDRNLHCKSLQTAVPPLFVTASTISGEQQICGLGMEEGIGYFMFCDVVVAKGAAEREGSGNNSIMSVHLFLQLSFAWPHVLTKSLFFVDWERGVDSHGRVYYIDHVNRTTTWVRPRQSKILQCCVLF